MNRAQRRAMLSKQRNERKPMGFDITNDTLEVNIINSEDTVKVDLLDFGVTEALYTMYTKFSDIEKYYKEDYDKAFGADGNVDARFELMKRVVHEFSDSVEAIFGEDSCKKIFGHKYPQIVQIAEFIEDFGPIAETIMSAIDVDSLRTEE